MMLATAAPPLRPDAFVEVGPATIGGRFLRRFWQPVLLARELTLGRALPVRLLGEDFTVYRGETGASHTVAFRCAHRGTQLSTGWVEGDALRCFYHGWVYGPDGQCLEQPAEPEPFCQRINIRSYPTQEYVGLIFVYLGDGAPPPFPRYPQLESAGVTETHAYARECSYFNSLENNMDEAHVAFVHRTSTFTSAGLNAALPEISGHETPYGMVRTGARPGGKVRVLHLVMPNLLVFKGAPARSGGAIERDQFAWRVPIDDVTHRSFNVSHAALTGAEAERYEQEMAERQGPAAGPSANEVARAVLQGELRVDDIPERTDIVNVQDAVAQVGQGQIADREHEHLGQTDVMIALLRRIYLRELQALAEGRPLTPWVIPERLAAAFGV
jgi:5,5'-dehydrodivanillate O-demethylase oxygenase subunit